MGAYFYANTGWRERWSTESGGFLGILETAVEFGRERVWSSAWVEASGAVPRIEYLLTLLKRVGIKIWLTEKEKGRAPHSSGGRVIDAALRRF